MAKLPDGEMTGYLGDPGEVSRVDKTSVVKVYCKTETSPWALTLSEPVPEAFELPASDWPQKIFYFLWPIFYGDFHFLHLHTHHIVVYSITMFSHDQST